MGSEVSKQEMSHGSGMVRTPSIDLSYDLMVSLRRVSKGANNCAFTTLVTAVKGLVTWYPSAADSQTESGA